MISLHDDERTEREREGTANKGEYAKNVSRPFRSVRPVYIRTGIINGRELMVGRQM